jgi:hypothetical protein
MALRAKMYQHAAEFFGEHGEHGKADRERELADRAARDAETDPRERVAGMKSHHLTRKMEIGWACGSCPVLLSQAPPPNPIAAEPDGRRVLSRPFVRAAPSVALSADLSGEGRPVVYMFAGSHRPGRLARCCPRPVRSWPCLAAVIRCLGCIVGCTRTSGPAADDHGR